MTVTVELRIGKTVPKRSKSQNQIICKSDKHCIYLEIVQVDALLSVGHAEEREDEEDGEDGPDEVPDRDDAGVPVIQNGQGVNLAS